MKEVWTNIKGFDNYQISNLGRGRSLERTTLQNNNGTLVEAHYKSVILTPIEYNKKGHRYRFTLYKNGKAYLKSRTRLVAEAFLPNPDNLPEVNHKNEKPWEDYVYINEDGSVNYELSNLEWISHKDNINYGTRNKRVSEKMTNGKLSKPVLQYTLDGDFVAEYPSTMEVQRQLGFDANNIGKVCCGKPHYKTAYGFIWKYGKQGENYL